MTNRNDTPLIVLRLPFPPSVNNLYANVPRRGRVPTERYKTWIRAAKNEVMAQPRQQPIEGEFELKILLGRPDRRRRDCSNYIKAPEDLLVRLGLIEDDYLSEGCDVRWSNKVKPKTATVLVWPAEAA